MCVCCVVLCVCVCLWVCVCVVHALLGKVTIVGVKLSFKFMNSIEDRVSKMEYEPIFCVES